MNETFLPVAEYRGIAILEKDGERRAVWNGQEYKTDGHVYLFQKGAEDEAIMLVCGFTSERNAKEMIDAIRDCPDEITPPFPPGNFMTMIEALTALHAPENVLERVRRHPPRYRWDDVAGVFV